MYDAESCLKELDLYDITWLSHTVRSFRSCPEHLIELLKATELVHTLYENQNEGGATHNYEKRGEFTRNHIFSFYEPYCTVRHLIVVRFQ